MRGIVRTLYDVQQLRIRTGNRLGYAVRDFLEERGHYSRMQSVSKLLAEAQELGFVHPLIPKYEMFQRIEKELQEEITSWAKTIDIWPWLSKVKGCGPTMSAVLIAEVIDPARFSTVSKLWAYAGLHVKDGRAPRLEAGKRANWNHFLRSKLIGVLGPSFLKAQSEYREYYDNYRIRLENRKKCSLPAHLHRGTTVGNGCTAGHIHAMAIRYMVKMFLRDFLIRWRELRGLEIRKPYAEEYLGRKHH